MSDNLDRRKICIIVPAYNESRSINRVIKQIEKVDSKFRIVVINDHSLDDTIDKVKKEDVTLLDLSNNLGIGGAVQTGIIYALQNGFKYAIQVDADGQHDPSYITKLIKEADSYDMIIGSRYIKKTLYSTPFLRRLGIRIFSRLIEMTCRKKIYDTTSGFRVFGPKTLALFSRRYPQEFPEPRSIVYLLKNGFKIKEVPVNMRERKTGRSSVTPLHSIYLMLSISIAIIFESVSKENQT